jgi:Protein of unknown function (DUF5663)
MFDFTFDHDAVLRELGLENSSPEVKAQVIEGIYEQLSMRMRVRLGGEMNAEDLQRFSNLADKSDAEAKAWLDSRFPDHEKMYREELGQLVTELKRHADVVVDASRNSRQ